MRSWAGWLLGLSFLLATEVPAAEPAASSGRRVRFSYHRGSGAADCPDETVVRRAVTERLGYDPFSTDAAENVAVKLVRTGQGLRAEIRVLDARGRAKGVRSLSSARNDCAELAAALALAVALAIDPLLIARPPPPSDCPACPDCPGCPDCPDCPPPAPPASPGRYFNIVGAHASFGAVPGGVGAGLRLGAGFAWNAASLALEGRVDPQLGTAAASSGRVGATLLTAALVPCAHRGSAQACAPLTAGSLRGEGQEIAAPRRDASFYAAAGVRMGFDLALPRRFFARLVVEGLATLTRTTLQVDDRPAWTTPDISATLGVVLGARWP